jgi:hypothetical protein
VQQLPICHAAITMIAKAYMREIIPRITWGKVPILLAPNTRFQGRYVRECFQEIRLQRPTSFDCAWSLFSNTSELIIVRENYRPYSHN